MLHSNAGGGEALLILFFFFSSRRRHTRFDCDWSSDVCSSDLTVLELLNRPEGFFAFRPAANHDVLLISKVQTVSLSVDRQAPIADPARLSAAKMLGVELVLTGGSTLGGWASAELPEHHARLLDYLNASRDPFFAVWTHAATHYVNRAYVLYARPLS